MRAGGRAHHAFRGHVQVYRVVGGEAVAVALQVTDIEAFRFEEAEQLQLVLAESAVVGDLRPDDEVRAVRMALDVGRLRVRNEVDYADREGLGVELRLLEGLHILLADREVAVEAGEGRGLEALEPWGEHAEIVVQLHGGIEKSIALVAVAAVVEARERGVGVRSVRNAERVTVISLGKDRGRVVGLRDGRILALGVQRDAREMPVRVLAEHRGLEVQAVRHLRAEVRAEVVALVVSVAHDAVLAHIAQRSVVAGLAVSAAGGDVVLLGEAKRLVDYVQPVGLRVEAHVLELLNVLGRPVERQAVHLADFVVPVDVLLGVHQLYHRGVEVEGDGAVVGDRVFAAGAGLGRDHDDAVRAVQAVDRGAGAVFQHGDRLDVVRVERLDYAYVVLDAVHHADRFAAAPGAEAADEHPRAVGARGAGGLDVRQAGEAACEELLGVSDRGLQNLLRGDLRDASGQIFPLALAVTDHHQFLELVVPALVKRVEINIRLFTGFLRPHGQAGERKSND